MDTGRWVPRTDIFFYNMIYRLPKSIVLGYGGRAVEFEHDAEQEQALGLQLRIQKNSHSSSAEGSKNNENFWVQAILESSQFRPDVHTYRSDFPSSLVITTAEASKETSSGERQEDADSTTTTSKSKQPHLLGRKFHCHEEIEEYFKSLSGIDLALYQNEQSLIQKSSEVAKATAVKAEDHGSSKEHHGASSSSRSPKDKIAAPPASEQQQAAPRKFFVQGGERYGRAEFVEQRIRLFAGLSSGSWNAENLVVLLRRDYYQQTLTQYWSYYFDHRTTRTTSPEQSTTTGEKVEGIIDTQTGTTETLPEPRVTEAEILRAGHGLGLRLGSSSYGGDAEEKDSLEATATLSEDSESLYESLQGNSFEIIFGYNAIEVDLQHGAGSADTKTDSSATFRNTFLNLFRCGHYEMASSVDPADVGDPKLPRSVWRDSSCALFAVFLHFFHFWMRHRSFPIIPLKFLLFQVPWRVLVVAPEESENVVSFPWNLFEILHLSAEEMLLPTARQKSSGEVSSTNSDASSSISSTEKTYTSRSTEETSTSSTEETSTSSTEETSSTSSAGTRRRTRSTESSSSLVGEVIPSAVRKTMADRLAAFVKKTVEERIVESMDADGERVSSLDEGFADAEDSVILDFSRRSTTPVSSTGDGGTDTIERLPSLASLLAELQRTIVFYFLRRRRKLGLVVAQYNTEDEVEQEKQDHSDSDGARADQGQQLSSPPSGSAASVSSGEDKVPLTFFEKKYAFRRVETLLLRRVFAELKSIFRLLAKVKFLELLRASFFRIVLLNGEECGLFLDLDPTKISSTSDSEAVTSLEQLDICRFRYLPPWRRTNFSPIADAIVGELHSDADWVYDEEDNYAIFKRATSTGRGDDTRQRDEACYRDGTSPVQHADQKVLPTLASYDSEKHGLFNYLYLFRHSFAHDAARLSGEAEKAEEICAHLSRQRGSLDMDAVEKILG
ncbi:unnamed protein product [Amoebophrya sp. A25]|nr:unnamed protein product [Amoebophrya sp. A25]|eukprot:GSA25T00024603001.1